MLINAVIGTPIGHSLSPEIHRAGYLSLGIEKEYSFLAIDIKSAELQRFIAEVRLLPFRGISVTIPHKVAALASLDQLSSEVEQLGAVNTIVNQEGQLVGYNTDWLGIFRPLDAIADWSSKPALVIGAGGAARSAIYALKQLNCLVSVFNRTSSKAEQLAKVFQVQSLSSINVTEEFNKFALVINCSSVGMHPNVNDSPFPEIEISAHQTIFDCVYNPLETQLMKRARKAGATVIPGSEMFLEQAFEQFKLYTGLDCPKHIARDCLLKHLASKE